MDAEKSLTVAEIAALVCVMEVLCPKPGNVSPGKPFRYINDMSFVASAMALSSAFAEGLSAGEMIERAVSATKRIVDRNTNLGIVLLLAPLAKVAYSGSVCRSAVERELLRLDAADSGRIYRAIALASPEGLGESEKFDVHSEPVDIMEAMREGARWDSVAGEYASGYETTFNVSLPLLSSFVKDGHTLRESVLQTYLMLLERFPDTLIARKLGTDAARGVSERAAEVLRVGGCFTGGGRKKLLALSHYLEDRENLLNPGTTADLTAAALFVFVVRELERVSLPDLLAGWDTKPAWE